MANRGYVIIDETGRLLDSEGNEIAIGGGSAMTAEQIRTALGIAVLSGANTGDQDLSGKVDKVTGSSLVPDSAIANIHAPGSDNQDLSGKADAVHTHAQSDVTGLVTALSGKSDTAHAHTSLAATGAITSSGAGIGYATGAGGTATQSTSKSTGVTLNKLCGTITMNAASLAANTTVAFTLTNSFVASTDIVLVTHTSTGTLGAYGFATAPGNGSVVISVRNLTAAAMAHAIVLRFIVIKAVTA